MSSQYISIKEALKGILSKSMDADEAFVRVAPGERDELAIHLAYVQERLVKSSLEEVCKVNKNGQWNIEKAIKPGPTLDYSKINPKADYKEIEAAAPTINYSNTPGSKPAWSGSTDRAQAVRSKIDAESKESAAETIARRQKIKKNQGTNLDAPVADKGRMTAKADMAGEMPDDGSSSMAMSEEGTPAHENKEKKIGKKIKDEAQDLLDMHKGEKKNIGGVEASPIFSMDHIGRAASAKSHQEAKHVANSAIKASNAHQHNKDKASLMVDQSKNSRHLAQGMTNFHMAHEAEVRKRLSGLNKDESRSSPKSSNMSNMQEKDVQKADGVGFSGIVSVGGGGKKRPVGNAVGEQAVRNE